MKYKTISGIKFYRFIFDVDTGQHFEITNGRWFERCGYFLLEQADNNKWIILKQVVSGKYEEERLSTLPFFVRARLYTFLRDNLFKYKDIQKIVCTLPL